MRILRRSRSDTILLQSENILITISLQSPFLQKFQLHFLPSKSHLNPQILTEILVLNNSTDSGNLDSAGFQPTCCAYRNKAVRLKRNITQQSLAEASSISLSSLKKIESGEIGTFDSLLRVLRTLGMLESIATLFEEEQMSPSECYDMVNKSKKQTRKRAVGQIKTDKEESEWQTALFRICFLTYNKTRKLDQSLSQGVHYTKKLSATEI